MKTPLFKIHTKYSKEDIFQMQKISTLGFRRIGLTASVALLILYAAVLIWQKSAGQPHATLFPGIPGLVLDCILVIFLLFCIAFTAALPYLQQRRILKAVPGGELRASYYFYDKMFQYGWGSNFSIFYYSEIEDFRDLPNSFYIKAKGTGFWVKKNDFSPETCDAFSVFIKDKISRK